MHKILVTNLSAIDNVDLQLINTVKDVSSNR